MNEHGSESNTDQTVEIRHLPNDHLDSWDIDFLRQRTEVDDPAQGVPLGTLSDFLGRYLALVNGSMPRLKVGEWLTIFDACKSLPLFEVNPTSTESGSGGSSPYPDHYTEIRLIPENLKNACQYEEDLGAKWGVDVNDLAARLEAMSFPEKLAVADAHTRFWNAPRSGQTQTWEEQLQELGIPIQEG